MIPDRKFVKRHRNLQNLGEDSPERIRSVIINYLGLTGEEGHCYDNISNILQNIKDHPLLYKNDISIDEAGIIGLDHDYRSHFLEKLFIKENGKEQYYYLRKIKKAEEQVKQIIEDLLKRVDYKISGLDFSDHIQKSTKELKSKIPNFDEVQFKKERKQQYENIFKKSLYILTGRPGSGKTFETSKVIAHLKKLDESVVILAPTGKSVLRLEENIRANTGFEIKVQTIDRFIYEKGYWWAYEDWERLDTIPESEKLTVENLIIDECSMIDLLKFKILLSIIRFNENYPKRLIMVGDENQLPDRFGENIS